MIDYDKYKAEHKRHYEYSKDFLIEHGSHPPMFIVIGKRNVHFLPADFSTPQLKYMFVQMCRTLAFKVKAEIVYFSSEIWFGSVAGETLSDIPQNYQPSTDPYRREGIYTVLWVKDQGAKMLVGEVIRDNDRIVAVTESEAFGQLPVLSEELSWLCGEHLTDEIKKAVRTLSVREILESGGAQQFKRKYH